MDTMKHRIALALAAVILLAAVLLAQAGPGFVVFLLAATGGTLGILGLIWKGEADEDRARLLGEDPRGH